MWVQIWEHIKTIKMLRTTIVLQHRYPSQAWAITVMGIDGVRVLEDIIILKVLMLETTTLVLWQTLRMLEATVIVLQAQLVLDRKVELRPEFIIEAFNTASNIKGKMDSKIVWNQNDGSQVTAWESPLEKAVFHYPAGSIDVKPPSFNLATETCNWNGSKWVVEKIPSEPELKAPTPETPEHIELEEAPEPEPEYVPTNADKRRNEYGSLYSQIEFITENGLEAWQSKVSEIKKKYPKE